MPLRTPYHMLMRPLPLATVAPGRAALVLIDVQAFTCQRDRGLDVEARQRGIAGELDEYFVQVEAALRNIARVLAACRETGIDVFHLRAASVPNAARHFKGSGLQRPRPGDQREHMAEATPVEGEAVIERGAYSPFLNTGLEIILKDRKVETVIMAGMMANIVMPLATREAADRGFNVLLMPDCCASETLDWHNLTMQGLVGGAIRVMGSGDVIDIIGGAVK